MKVNIENYFGNNIVSLDFTMVNDNNIKNETFGKIFELATELGYRTIYTKTEPKIEITLFQLNVDETEEEENEDLLKLVNGINKIILKR